MNEMELIFSNFRKGINHRNSKNTSGCYKIRSNLYAWYLLEV